MFQAALRFILAGVMVSAILIALTSVGAIFTGVLQAARQRKPEISIFRAIAAQNVIFRPELYDERSLKWRKLHILGFVALFSSLVVAEITSFCLSKLE
jgi:hypothetical protein